MFKLKCIFYKFRYFIFLSMVFVGLLLFSYCYLYKYCKLRADTIAFIFTALFAAIASFSSFRLYKKTWEEKLIFKLKDSLDNFAKSLMILNYSIPNFINSFSISIITDPSLKSLIELLRQESSSSNSDNDRVECTEAIKKIFLSAQVKANHEIDLISSKIKFANYNMYYDFPLSKKFHDWVESTYSISYKCLFDPRTHIEELRNLFAKLIEEGLILKQPDIYIYPAIFNMIFEGLNIEILNNKDFRLFLAALIEATDLFRDHLYKSSTEELIVISKQETKMINDFLENKIHEGNEITFSPIFDIIKLKEEHLKDNFEKIQAKIKEIEIHWQKLKKQSKKPLSSPDTNKDNHHKNGTN